MQTIQTITLHAKEVNNNGNKFIACTACINEKWYKIKFVRSCQNHPAKRGLYHLTFDIDNCSFESGKQYVKNDGTYGTANDTIWINEIVCINEFDAEEMKELNRSAFSKVFG